MNKQIFGSLEHLFHKNSWRIATVFIIIAILSTAIFLLPRSAAKTIQLTGEGKVTIAPDTLRYSAIVESKKLTADEASKATSDQVALIAKLLVAKGLSADDIKMQTVIVAPEYQSTPTGAKVSNYSGQETLAVTFGDVTKQEEIAQILIQNGASSLIGPTPIYSPEKVSTARKAAETKAIADAKSRAASVVKESGYKLGDAIKISEPNIAIPAPAAAAQITEGQAGSGSANSQTLPTNENEITVQITVTYLLK